METDNSFESIIKEIGGFGRYQKRVLFVVLGIYYFLLPLSWINEIFLLTVPEHWCSHPVESGLNATQLKEWKKCFLPIEIEGGYDSCRIMKPVDMSEDEFWSESISPSRLRNRCPSKEKSEIVDCKDGWTFDKSNFLRTIPMENGWVCGNGDSNIPRSFMSGMVGSIFGSSIYNLLGDVFGRKTMTTFSILNVVVFTLLKTFLTGTTIAYMIFKALASAAYSSAYQLPFAMIMEISTPKGRSYALAYTSIAWTTGLCFLPLLAWLLSGDWYLLSLISVLPLLLTGVFYKWFPESPRWLLSTKNGYARAEVIVKEIAQVNGVPITDEDTLKRRLKAISNKIPEEKSGILKDYRLFFSNRGLNLKTFCLCITSIANFYVYFQIMINIHFNQINVFLMFFALSIIEGPGYLLGQYCLEKFGRRWSHTALLGCNVLVMFIIIVIKELIAQSVVIVSILCVCAKLFSCAAFLIFEVQATEIYPTKLRTSGIGFTYLIALLVGLTGPYIIYIGGSIPYLFMGLLCLLGAVAAAFLPETKERNLPETLEDAALFGHKNKEPLSSVCEQMEMEKFKVDV